MAPSKHAADAILTVTRAATVLGVHPNTVRTWSDQGRIPFLRVNARGDRRYRMADLARFLEDAENPALARRRRKVPPTGDPSPPTVLPLGADIVEERTRPADARFVTTAHRTAPVAVDFGQASGGGGVGQGPVPLPGASYARLVRISADDGAGSFADTPGPFEHRRPPPELSVLADLLALLRPDVDPSSVMTAAVEGLHDRAGHDLVAVLERRGTTLVPRVARGVGSSRLEGMSAERALPGLALAGTAPVVETAPPSHVEEWLAPGRLLRGRIAVPIGIPGSPAWGILVVADEGSAAARDWMEFVGAVARIIGLAIHLGPAGHEPSGLTAPLRAIQSLGARLSRPAEPTRGAPDTKSTRGTAAPESTRADDPEGPSRD